MAIKHEMCKMCHGTGQIRDMTTTELVKCYHCDGLRYKTTVESDKNEPELAADDPRAMQDDEYEAKRLGTVIFLIGAGFFGLQLGVNYFQLASTITELPPWYYASVVAVIGAVTYFFHTIVTTLTLVVVFGAALYWAGGFVLEHFF